MNQNWIVENLNNAFSTWNGKLTELWGLVTTSPQSFKGGAVWGVMQSLHSAMVGIGYALIVLFFAISLFKNTMNFHELKRPEAALHYLIRFVAAKALVGYGMDIMLNIFSICNGVVSDTAIILMVDSNCQREHILPSEKAKAYQMKLEAVKRKSGRPSKINSGQVGPNFDERRSNQIVADEAGESVKQVQRFIRLNKLTPELMKMVDDGKLKTTPAVELSYLTPEEQEDFLSYMESEGCTPSLSQAQKLKEASKESVLTSEKIQHIMAAKPPSVKPRDPQLMIPVAKVERYFPKGFTSDQMQQVIVKLLENYARAHQHGSR